MMTKKHKKLMQKIRHMQTKGYLKKQQKIKNRNLLKWWSATVKDIAGNVCSNCGSNVRLNSHHILAKERYLLYKHELINGICLCSVCHKFGKLSAHKNPIWFSRFLEVKYPDKYKWAVEHL